MTSIVYLHGVPGSTAELGLFAPSAKHIIAPDHLAFASVEQLAASLPPGPLHLIGFSLGAFSALQLSAMLESRVKRLDIVSPAGPLELGDFLPLMAGGDVFRMARDHPTRFGILVQFQTLLARWAPSLLHWLLFQSARGGDARLAGDAAFKAMISSALRQTFCAHKAGYRAVISAYVAVWAEQLPSITAPTHIWQGMADNWTPPAMAEALAKALPNVHSFTQLEGGSHYSTLAHVLPTLVD